jgi:hypothetical protein
MALTAPRKASDHNCNRTPGGPRRRLSRLSALQHDQAVLASNILLRLHPSTFSPLADLECFHARSTLYTGPLLARS